MRILVSACLVGIPCKYSGGNNLSEAVMTYLSDKSFVPVCPEQLGGLPTPRACCEISEGRVMDETGIDRTEAFERGADAAVAIARMTGCTHALLQERSPSCGVHRIYDGTFTGRKVAGSGIAARRLGQAGLIVLSSGDLDEK